MSSSVAQNKSHWSTINEAGTLFGLRLLMLLYRFFGRRLFSVLLFPVALYFVVSRPNSRRASIGFLRTHYQFFPEQWSVKPGYWQVVKHFHQFAEAILDKLLAWSADMSINEFDVKNSEAVDALMSSKRGRLIIGTHLGNLEYCRGFIQRYEGKAINVLLYDKHAENFVSMMQRINPHSRLNILQVDELDVATLLRLKDRIDRGEWVFIAGDRTPLAGAKRTVNVSFLARQAPLPIGPYVLAKALACPVNLMFSYRYNTSKGSKIYFEMVNFSDKVELSRHQRQTDLQCYAQKFATELESQCAKAPYQWFNFYDFWATQSIFVTQDAVDSNPKSL
ncbi:MAG: acyltransferase [Gammaproteobacteria bacterium]|nr:acyltransferase [Gammaproteobacteria bacterium]